MANIVPKYIFQTFSLVLLMMIMVILTSNVVKSDQIDCKNVQCPPIIKCPSDSYIHQLYQEPSAIPPDVNYSQEDNTNDDEDDTSFHQTTNSIDNTVAANYNLLYDKNQKSRNDNYKATTTDASFHGNNNFPELPKLQKITNDNPLEITTKGEINNNNHQLNKRSVQYKRRESIKIIPGDYISGIDHYDPHNYQSVHKKRKRSTNLGKQLQFEPTSSTEQDKCCPKQICLCKSDCEFPKCAEIGKVAVEVRSGNRLPGNCCPIFRCIDQEPDCANESLAKEHHPYFWLNECKQCECNSGQRICHKMCDMDDENLDDLNLQSYCFSSKHQKAYKNGEVWKEDKCTECECDNGERNCQISLCKELNCQNQVQSEDDCCARCSTDLIIPNKTISSSTDPAVLCEIYPSRSIPTESSINEMSAHERLLTIFIEHKETIILYFVIVALLIICALFIFLYIREITRKSTSYRSIPSTDSNLSHSPKPTIKTPTP